MPGPYATEREAIADALDVLDSPPGTWHDRNEDKLREAFGAAGVETDAYDDRIACWLAGHAEPQVVQVVIGWIVRAGER